MMWVDNTTECPSRRNPRTYSRRARVLITSSPLLGSSISTVCGVCTMARAMATLTRWPCEKPSVRRSMKSAMSSVSIRWAMRSRIFALLMP